MNTTGFESFSMIFWPLHGLACIAVLVGIIFLIVWAVKTLTPAQLKIWGISLAAIGVVLCLLITSMGGTHVMYRKGNADMKMIHKMDDERDLMEHDAMEMSMNDMSAMLEGKTGDAFDQAFLEGMIPHHQGAIEMAREVLKSAKHDELKNLARDIITAQQTEIDMMNNWLKEWGYTE